MKLASRLPDCRLQLAVGTPSCNRHIADYGLTDCYSRSRVMHAAIGATMVDACYEFGDAVNVRSHSDLPRC